MKSTEPDGLDVKREMDADEMKKVAGEVIAFFEQKHPEIWAQVLRDPSILNEVAKKIERMSEEEKNSDLSVQVTDSGPNLKK